MVYNRTIGWVGERVSLFVCAVVVGAADPAACLAATPAVVTEHGFGLLRLGRTLGALRREGLVGSARPGCELASPRPLVARLRAPLAGWATFGGGAPPRLRGRAVPAGAGPRNGIAVGAPAAMIEKAFPAAHVVDS